MSEDQDWTNELQSMDKIVTELEALDPLTRGRMMRYLVDRYPPRAMGGVVSPGVAYKISEPLVPQ